MQPGALQGLRVLDMSRVLAGQGVRGVASPLRLSRTPVAYRYGPPGLGDHTASVLADWLDRR